MSEVLIKTQDYWRSTVVMHVLSASDGLAELRIGNGPTYTAAAGDTVRVVLEPRDDG